MAAQQSKEALAKANRTRLARAELKQAIKGGDVLVAEVLLSEIPDWLEQMSVEELVLAAARLQWRQWQHWAYEIRANLTARVDGLGSRRRHQLALLLSEWEVDARERRRARSRRALVGGRTTRKAAA